MPLNWLNHHINNKKKGVRDMDYKNVSNKQLIEKINNLKAERERTADCLKQLEKELKKRKNKVPLGVPCDGKFYVDVNGRAGEVWKEKVEEVNFNAFNSKKSAEKHAEMLLAWRKALVANANGEPIDIKVLFSFLRKGWVAMDKNGRWYWHDAKPIKDDDVWLCSDGSHYAEELPKCFNIKSAEDWCKSLMECGL